VFKEWRQEGHKRRRDDERAKAEIEKAENSGRKTKIEIGGQRPEDGSAIPKGLNHAAQGCEERATLGKRSNQFTNPERVVAI